MSDATWTLGATALRQRIVAGELSAQQALNDQLARIDALQPRLRAFATLTAEAAMQEARRCDAALQAGQPPGALHGVPVGIKDLFDTAGVVTAVGTRVLAERVPQRDATAVARLRAAGAVLPGKLVLTEGAFSSHHPDRVPPLNPRRADLWSGVSSSGSGVAVAAGLCPAALGTDTGGSIRFPSAANAVVGLKPTYGRISRAGAFPLADSLDHMGPMAREVRDLALLLEVLAGADPADPTSLAAPAGGMQAAVAAATSRGAADLRVGWDPDYGAEHTSPEVGAALQRAVDELLAAGAAQAPAKVPEHRDLVDGWAVTCGVEAALAHAPWYPARRQAYGEQLAALLDLGHAASGRQYALLERARERFRAASGTLFSTLDVLLAPALPGPVPTLDEQARRLRDGSGGFMVFTAPWNYGGQPCLTLPAGQTTDGRPLAIQLIAAPLGEAALLRAAAVLEACSGFGCPGVAGA